MKRSWIWLLLPMTWGAFLVVGYWLGHVAPPMSTAPNVLSTKYGPRVEYLPPNEMFLFYEQEGSDLKIRIYRPQDMSTFSEVTIFNKDKNTLRGSFYETSGRIRELRLARGHSQIRAWMFRENGTLESETVFNAVGNVGAITYYAEDGSKEREGKEIYHHD